MSEPHFKVGDQVMVKKGLMKAIREGRVSNEYNYVDRMDQLAESEKVLTVASIYERYMHQSHHGYQLKGCPWDFNYNEAWLLPVEKTNERLAYLLQEEL